MRHGKLFLYQPSKGYRYNSDTIFLADFIASFRLQGDVLDVGCGVGILGLIVRRHFPVTVYGVDIQPHMISYAKRNFALNRFEFQPFCGEFVSQYPNDRTFDVIVSNPPFYHPNVDQSDDTVLNIARYAHHLPLEAMIAKAKRMLKPRGYLFFCYDAKQIDDVLHQLKKHKLNPEAMRFVHPKADREAKLVLVAARAGSKSMMKIRPPLIVFDEQSRYLPEASAAFEKAGTHVVTGDECGITTHNQYTNRYFRYNHNVR